MIDTPVAKARNVIRYLAGGRKSAAFGPVRAACRRIVAAGNEDANPGDLAILAAEVERRHHAEQRMTSSGVACIGDEVIYDGEAEALGLKPLKRWSDRPRRATAATETEAGPKGPRKGRGRTAASVAHGEPPAR